MAMVEVIEETAFPETTSMAKGKAKEPSPGETVKTLFAIKGSRAWNAWLKEFADSLGTNSLGAIDQCLRDKAEERGFKPMPKRMPRKGAS
jgi:Fe-S cluster biosynthesis and repair protein YggX